MEINKKNKVVITIILIVILIIIYIIYLYTNNAESINALDIDLNDAIYNNEQEENINNSGNTKNIIENDFNVNELNQYQENEIVVHITGEVKREGIVYLQKGDRIVNAIAKAGGETKNADLSQVNLAYELQDGEKIYIPNKNEKVENYIISGNNTSIDNDNETQEEVKETIININTADESELDTLPGIGPSIAKKIITYRNENGKFNTIEDIKNVSGIGDAKFEEIKKYITV